MAKQYPEHEKLKAEKHKTEIINEFFEWAENKHFELKKDGLSLTRTEYNNVLAEFIGVDLKKLEAEKVAMLDAMRKANETA